MTAPELVDYLKELTSEMEMRLEMLRKTRVITITMKDNISDSGTQDFCDKLKKWSTREAIKSISWGYYDSTKA